jgi:methionyl-tRNA formyltransferase
MRLVFAGTPAFARAALIALADDGHEILAVLTQPDRASGRGLAATTSPVKEAAIERGFLILQPESLKATKPGAAETIRTLIDLKPDLMVVAAYGLLLPQEVLDIPVHGCLNIHASLLPRWRGAAPIQRAIAAGDRQTGISLMQMHAGLDTGPVWTMHKTPVLKDDNFQSLHDRLSALGAVSIVELLKNFPPPNQQAIPQPADGITYAHKITKHDQPVDWGLTAAQVAAHIQSLDPQPGATSVLKGVAIKLGQARALDQPENILAEPGKIIQADKEGLIVCCGTGAVSVNTLQRAGGKRLGFREFLNGCSIMAGDQFDAPPAVIKTQ